MRSSSFCQMEKSQPTTGLCLSRMAIVKAHQATRTAAIGPRRWNATRPTGIRLENCRPDLRRPRDTLRQAHGVHPMVACCLDSDRICVEMDLANCVEQDGRFQGPKTICRGNGDENGSDDGCGQVIPAASEWGLIVMPLALLVGIKIRFDGCEIGGAALSTGCGCRFGLEVCQAFVVTLL